MARQSYCRRLPRGGACRQGKQVSRKWRDALIRVFERESLGGLPISICTHVGVPNLMQPAQPGYKWPDCSRTSWRVYRCTRTSISVVETRSWLKTSGDCINYPKRQTSGNNMPEQLKYVRKNQRIDGRRFVTCCFLLSGLYFVGPWKVHSQAWQSQRPKNKVHKKVYIEKGQP